MDQKTHHSSQSFEAEPSSASIVRQYVRESLDSLRLGSDEAVLLANELATNAIVHAAERVRSRGFGHRADVPDRSDRS